MVATMIFLVWLIRSVAEVVFFRIGQDGAWWRVVLFLVAAAVYAPAVFAARPQSTMLDRRVPG